MNTDVEVLSTEQEIVLLLARLTFTKEEETRVRGLVETGRLDWYFILNACAKNKVLGLAWGNLLRLRLEHLVAKPLLPVMKFYHLGLRKRTESYILESRKIAEVLEASSIRYALLKGAYLAKHIYPDYGLRNMNDMDILVDHADVPRITLAMKELGYCQGDYDKPTRTIREVSRTKQILWKNKMNNMYPFLKIADSDYINCFKLDFCFSLDLDLKKQDVRDMLERAEGGVLQPADFFLHLCCHFYKEATNLAWIYNVNDLTLIKLCDIREYILARMDEVSLRETMTQANKLGYREAVYYTLYYLKSIYNDGYEERWMKLLDVQDMQFLQEFGRQDYGESSVWRKSIQERIFSSSNKDELDGFEPKHRLLEE